MKILIVYASNSGSNYLTAQVIQEVLQQDNEVVVKHARYSTPEDIQNYDMVIFGSPSWKVDSKEGQPHEFMTEFIQKLTTSDLQGKTVAFYGCGDRSYLRFCGAVDEMEKMLADKNVLKSVDSLKIDSFYFEMDKNIEIIKNWAKVLEQSLVTSII